MLDNLDIFIKARKADFEDIKRWMRSFDNLADGGDYVIERVTPDGLIFKVRMNDDFRANINLMDESGEMLQDTLRVGKRIDDSGEVAGDAGKIIKGKAAGESISILKETDTFIDYLNPAGEKFELISNRPKQY